MKTLKKILFVFALTATGNLLLANGAESFESSQQINPQGELQQKPDEISVSESSEETGSSSEIQPSDTVSDESVSKYNFIFYYLYKLKYNEDTEIEDLY